MNWFLESNRWKHFLGGMAIGALSDDWYCATLAGVTTAGALEFKDKEHGDNWDWLDFFCTIAGVALGYGARYLITMYIK